MENFNETCTKDHHYNGVEDKKIQLHLTEKWKRDLLFYTFKMRSKNNDFYEKWLLAMHYFKISIMKIMNKISSFKDISKKKDHIYTKF